MRKLKLQMQITVDGFVSGPDGELDWMTWNMDEKLIGFINQMTDSSDTIVMGRKMTDGFIDYWTGVQPDSPEYEFARKMIEIPKVVFSRTIEESPWINTIVASDLARKIDELKAADGSDIVVYGGAELVANLIADDLLDDLYLFVNPASIGDGRRIFSGGKKFALIDSTPYECGVVVNHYRPLAA